MNRIKVVFGVVIFFVVLMVIMTFTKGIIPNWINSPVFYLSAFLGSGLAIWVMKEIQIQRILEEVKRNEN